MLEASYLLASSKKHKQYPVTILEGIIQHMIYITRCRRLVKAVFYEQSRIDVPKNKDKRDETQFPLEKDCLKTFNRNNKKYAKNTEIGSKTIILAHSGGYITDADPHATQSTIRLAITGPGIRLLTFTGYMNELAKSVNAFLPIAISIIALAVSIIALVVES